MSVTIESLDIQITSSAGSASANIDRLAESLGKLRDNSKLTAVSNNLNKLADSLTKLQNASAGLSGITALARAMEALSGIQKASGLNNTLNSLKKLPEITNKLDAGTISAFSAKARELAAALAPLSREIERVGNGFSKLPNKVSKVVTATNRMSKASRSAEKAQDDHNESISAFHLNLSTVVNNIQNYIGLVQQIQTTMAAFLADAIEWDGIQFRFGRAFGEDADETYDYLMKLSDALKINTQQFMQYSSMFGSLLSGFGVAQDKTTTISVGMTELAYDIWAAYNDRYKTLEDSFEAIRSAITGEIEPIRNAGIAMTEASMQEYLDSIGMASVSIEKLTEAQKAEVRYAVMVNSAMQQGIVGTYAKEMNTAEGAVRTLTQQLKTLVQSIGSLFIPILQVAVPWVSAFVEILIDAVKAIADFFDIPFMEISWDSPADGLGGITDGAEGANEALNGATEAAKKLKHYTMGFDELNVIDPNSGSGSGGAGAGAGAGWGSGLDLDTLWDESVFTAASTKIDEIKKKILDFMEEWKTEIALVAAALGTLSLAGFIGGIGDAIAKMGTLKKAVSSIALLTIEAVLVFMFADNYLESGRLEYLLGEALATAGGTYLMYKGWGAKGAVFALGVSIAMQLMALTLNIADGTVKSTDLETMIQAAFTSLTSGVTGGWLANKGLIKMSTGKGIGIGVLVGFSLSLASIAFGEIAANGVSLITWVQQVFSTLAGGAAGAGIVTALGLASGGTGFLIGAAVMLAVNVIGAIVASIDGTTKADIEKELNERFGKIELTNEMIEVYVDRITAIPGELIITTDGRPVVMSVDSAIDLFVSEKQIQDDIKADLENAVKTMETLYLKIAVGIDVEQTEMEKAIDTYVTQAQRYLDQGYLTMSIALSFLGGEKGESLSDTLNVFYTESSAELTRLGQDLKQTIAEGFVDGEWIPDKLQEAKDIQTEIQETLSYLSDVEFRAEMANLSLSVSGTDLTPESLEKVMESAHAAVSEKLNALDEIKMSQLQVAVIEYDANIAAGKTEAEAKKIYDETVAEIEAQFQAGKIEVTYGSFDFGLQTIRDAFADALTTAESTGLLDFDSMLNNAIKFNPATVFDEGAGAVYGNIDVLIRDIAWEFDSGLSEISPEVRGALEKTLAVMKPTVEDFEEIAATARTAGTMVPEEIRDGLNDHAQLAALSGDADALNYLIGQKFSTDTTFLNTLATVEGAGANIDDSVAKGLLNNLTYVTDQATGVVTGIKNSMTGEVIAVTPELVKNMKQLGVDITGGLVNGAETSMQESKKTWKDWAIWPWNWFKEKNEINSPSKLFERGGGYLVSGLLQGLSTGWTNLKTWFKTNIEPKLTLSYWVTKFTNIKTGFTQTIKNAVNAGIDLMNRFIRWINQKLNFSWDGLKIGGKTIFEGGSVQLFTIPTIPRLEKGGFLEDGLFTMNHGEIAGRFNNGKSVVANNQQIVDGIAAGVYEAVVSAMNATNGRQDQNVNVYLDGKQIYSSVKKTEAQRGRSIMGNQLGYAY